MTLETHRQRVGTRRGWIGEVPTGWNLVPLGSVFRERKVTVSDKDYVPLSVSMGGVVPRMDNVALTFNNDARKLVKAGDYVINSRSDRKGSGGIAPTDGSVSVISTVLRPVGIEPSFAHHLLRSTAFQEEFYRWGSGIVADLWSTRYQAMKQIILPLPPVDEQRAIADFLDRETAEIDLLIEKQTTLIDRLRERHESIVSAATTFGSDTPRVQLRRLTSAPIEAGANETGDANNPAEWPRYIRTTDIATMSSLFPARRVTVPPRIARTASVLPGDILATRAGATIGKSYLHSLDEDAAYAGYLVRIRLKTSVALPRYVAHWMQGRDYWGQVSSQAIKSTIENFSASRYRALRVPIPPIPQQQEVADRLDRETAKIDELITKTEHFINLTRERRSALITAAVTGQIDVTGQGAA